MFGLIAAGITAATAAASAIAQSQAEKPMGRDEIDAAYDQEVQKATNATRDAAQNSLMSLANSGGSPGEQSAARRAAMLQTPEIQGQATLAGYHAGGAMANARTNAQFAGYDARQQRMNNEIGAWNRFGGALATGAADASTASLYGSQQNPGSGPQGSRPRGFGLNR